MTTTSARPSPEAQHVTVVIPTCDRPADLKRCLDSLSAIDYPSWEILILDQSCEEASRRLVGEFGQVLPKVTYRHMSSRGSARLRNAALSTIKTGIVAFLDDDCTVQPSWLHDVAAVFDRHPEAAVVFGAVRSAPHDPSRDFIPALDVTDERSLIGRLSFLRSSGRQSACMGASMHLNLDRFHHTVPHRLHIDENTGAGARFAGEDLDFFYRVLASGYTVVVTPSVSVLHYGARSFVTGEAQRLLWRYVFSTGAMHMKYLRCGDANALVLMAATFWKYLRMVDLRGITHGRRPTHLRFVVAYVCGLFGSFQLGVDGRRYLYAPRNYPQVLRKVRLSGEPRGRKRPR